MKDKWDKYFFDICNTVSQKSTCLSRQIGAVLTKENRIIATGYNGPPSGIDNCADRCYNDHNLRVLLENNNIDPYEASKQNICPRKLLKYPSGEGLELCPAIHAEKNCLLSAARNGISTKETIIYLNTEISPCSQCFGALINAGVQQVVLIKNNPYDKTVEWLECHNKLKIREYDI